MTEHDMKLAGLSRDTLDFVSTIVGNDTEDFKEGVACGVRMALGIAGCAIVDGYLTEDVISKSEQLKSISRTLGKIKEEREARQRTFSNPVMHVVEEDDALDEEDK